MMTTFSTTMFLFAIAISLSFSSAHLNVLGKALVAPSTLSSELNGQIVEDVGKHDPTNSTALCFHVPKSGGTTIKQMVGHCLGLVVASQVGITGGHGSDKTIRKFSLRGGSSFVNVDTTAQTGLIRAKELGFAASGLADVVFTTFLPQAINALFDDDHLASIFTLFRHPVSREISKFYYLQDATWEKTYHPEWKNLTLANYLKGPDVEHDWMVRNIVGKYMGNLNSSDLDIAKAFVSKKIWVGLLQEMEESMDRFGALYGWNKLPKWELCVERFANHGSNGHSHPKVHPKSEEWKLLQAANQYDMQLFVHAVTVFEQQRQFFGDDEENA